MPKIPTAPVAGQRWLSEAEPELGLGFVLSASFGQIEILFPAARERRVYALSSAPLRRMRFSEGDRVIDRKGRRLAVQSVEEADGLLTYLTDEGPLPEAELSETISYSSAEDRLLAGQSDNPDQFDLRLAVMQRLAEWRSSELRGFTGPRMDLIPHQLTIAREVCARLRPRVLLSDEVGLGKTIEACLIMHRLVLSGRVSRVLIVVPEMLVHQWFVELLRRFHMSFKIFDADRFEALQAADNGNPFHDEQLVIVGQEFAISRTAVREAIVSAGWDLLVVDEAHHLEWTPGQSSPAYQLVETLAAATVGLLLLTATPQQLGIAGHYARLRLLDPERYPSLELFKEELEEYERLAKWMEKMDKLGVAAIGLEDLPAWDAKAESWKRYVQAWPEGERRKIAEVTEEVLDAFGPGREIFRNTRARLSGFPGRKVHMEPLSAEGSSDPVAAESLQLTWLLALLKKLRNDKVLLICSTQQKADELVEAIARQTSIAIAAFHEGMNLMQRDRSAAYFADPEGGRMLVCSEIGSEGRNFQFAHHLVLWDLPQEPDLIEQRIGRLDRIGQTARIHIYVPFMPGTRKEVVARWLHDGLGVFAGHVPGAHQLGEACAQELAAIGDQPGEAQLQAFIDATQARRKELHKRLRSGRDRLLESSASRRAAIDGMISELQREDADLAAEAFVMDLLEEIGVQVNEDGPRAYHLEPVRLKVGTLPFLPHSGVLVTFDRKLALAREDVPFLSMDHPMIEAALETYLEEGNGNCSCAIWNDPDTSAPEGIFLELVFVAEAVAPAALHLDRFFPSTPVQVVFDHQCQKLDTATLWQPDQLQPVEKLPILERKVFRKRLFPTMLEAGRTAATTSMERQMQAARQAVRDRLDPEIQRLELLTRLNDNAYADEAQALRDHKAELLEALGSSHIRLDALRLVWRGAV